MNFSNNSSLTAQLEDLNDAYAVSNIGGIVFVGLMMIIGIIGNAHVLYIYAFKFKPSNHRVYILCMASLDMTTCCIGMPFVIVDLRNPLMFEAAVICKCLRFLNYFMVTGSMFTLIVMAVDRYKSICRPFEKQMSTETAKYACVISVFFSICLSWPAPVLYGNSTVDAKMMTSYFKIDYNVTGTHCYTEDRFKKTKYQAYFNIVLITIFFMCFCVLTVLYSLIARKIIKNSNMFASDNVGESIKVSAITSTDSEFNNNNTISNNLKRSNRTGNVELLSLNKTGNIEILSFNKICSDDHKPQHGFKTINDHQNRMKQIRDHQSKNITFLLAIISIVFLVSYVLHLSLKILAMLRPNFFLELSRTELFLYNTFVWSFFISNMSNPLIYGFCVSQFRKQVRLLYKRKKDKPDYRNTESSNTTSTKRTFENHL